MVILEVNKVKSGLIRVTTDEKELLVQADGEIKAFGESFILMDCADTFGLIDIETLTSETLEIYDPPVIDTENYFGGRGGLVIASEEEREYVERIIDFMKKEFNSNEGINSLDELISHLFKLCVSRNTDPEILLQILSLSEYDEDVIWNQDFYIAFSLAELLI